MKDRADQSPCAAICGSAFGIVKAKHFSRSFRTTDAVRPEGNAGRSASAQARRSPRRPLNRNNRAVWPALSASSHRRGHCRPSGFIPDGLNLTQGGPSGPRIEWPLPEVDFGSSGWRASGVRVPEGGLHWQPCSAPAAHDPPRSCRG